MKRTVVSGLTLLLIFAGQLLNAPRAAGFGYTANLNGASQNPPNASSGTCFAFLNFNGNQVEIFNAVPLQYSGLTGNALSLQLHGPTATSGLHGSGIAALESAKAATVANVPPALAPWPLPGGTSGTLNSYVADLTQASAWDPAYLAAHGGSTAAATADLYSGLAFIGPNAGKIYVSIKTTAFPDGEIRGFLQGFPEPASGTLAVTALSAMALFRRRQLNRLASSKSSSSK